jgi:hypothetical protein
VKYFDETRTLVDGPPCEFWDDIEYQPSMDESYHHWMQPQWDKERKFWMDKLKGKDNGAYGCYPNSLRSRCTHFLRWLVSIKMESGDTES